MKNKHFIAATVAALGVGVGVGAVALAPTIVGASEPAVRVMATSDTTVPGGAASATDPARPNPGQREADALKPLVAAGTITQAQADAVLKALAAARPPHVDGRGGFGGPKGFGAAAADVSKALGISEADLRTAIESGKSLADIAKANGKDPAAIAKVIQDEMTARIDQAAKDGKLTADQAAKAKADAADRATAIVNGTAPLGGRGPGRGGFDDHGPRGPVAPLTPATPPTTTVS